MGEGFDFFAIMGVMRTGSNLLQRTLTQFDDIACCGELFNPSFVEGPKKVSAFGYDLTARERDPFGLISAMRNDPETQGKLTGFRFFDGHDPRVEDGVLIDRRAAKIILRRDTLDSYISLLIARTTGQWMLGKARARRTAMVTFNSTEYRSYLDATNQFYMRLERGLKVSGQSAFMLNYDDVTDLDVINGLAKWLGSKHRLSTLEQTIHRQNPGPMSEKVTNYAEMMDELSTGQRTQVETRPITTRAGGLRHMHISAKYPLIYAEIPGGPTMPVLRWVYGLDGGDPQDPTFETLMETDPPFAKPANRKDLDTWMLTHPDALNFTCLSHPLTRAYAVFMSHILPGGDAGYPRIRQYIETHYNMRLPAEAHFALMDRLALTSVGYDLDSHRDAFLAFLEFVRDSLSGKTAIRVDALWDTQKSFVEGFNSALTLGLIARDVDLLAAAGYIKRRFSIPDVRNAPLRNISDHPVFPLGDIYCEAIENSARAAYATDYEAFGFTKWRQN